MKLLVSLCNQRAWSRLAASTAYLLEVDVDLGRVSRVPLRHPRLRGMDGTTGLAGYRDGVLVVTQSQRPQLLFLNRNNVIERVADLKVARDPHSIAVRGEHILIASTGTDAVVGFDWEQGESVIWGNASGAEDTLHLNSIAVVGEDIHASTFGRKRGEYWVEQGPVGQVMNLRRGSGVIEALEQPHSLCAAEHGLFVCESAAGVIHTAAGESLQVGSAYIRGLAVTPGSLFVATSRQRQWSRSKGTLIVHDQVEGHCELLIYALNAGSFADSPLRRQVCLDEHADEVYDLLVRPGKAD